MSDHYQISHPLLFYLKTSDKRLLLTTHGLNRLFISWIPLSLPFLFGYDIPRIPTTLWIVLVDPTLATLCSKFWTLHIKYHEQCHWAGFLYKFFHIRESSLVLQRLMVMVAHSTSDNCSQNDC